MNSGFTESVVEDAALGWLETQGYSVLHGPDIAFGEPNAERGDPDYRDVLLQRRLREALARLNPDLPPDALDDAWRKLTRSDAPSLVEKSRAPTARSLAGRRNSSTLTIQRTTTGSP